MVTIDVENGKAKLYGKSTDTKPTISFKGVALTNSSTFFEMDTQEVFFYDGDTNSWLPQP